MREPINHLIAERETVWGASRLSFVMTLMPQGYLVFALFLFAGDKGVFAIPFAFLTGWVTVKYCARRTSKDPWWFERLVLRLIEDRKSIEFGG